MLDVLIYIIITFCKYIIYYEKENMDEFYFDKFAKGNIGRNIFKICRYYKVRLQSFLILN